MRVVIYTLLIMVAAASLVALTVLLQRVNPVQQKPDFEPYCFPDTLANREYDLDSLKAIIGDNKGLPEGFEVAAAIAYSAFPQLKDVKIDMVLTQQGAPMESTPKVSTLFGPRKKRQYFILLNHTKEKDTFFEPILLRSLPFDAQVGILAHELGHVVYYERLNLFKFGKWGLKYLKDDQFRATHERTTDLMVVYHGLGSQIYQYAYFVRKDSSCVEFFKKEQSFMDKYYMNDVELLEVIKAEAKNK